MMDVHVDGDGSTNVENEKNNPKSESKLPRGHEITTKTIKVTPFSYICLELITSSSNPALPSLLSTSPFSTKPDLDALTVRTYLTSALTQFLGLTGSAISIDILKIEGPICWIRTPRDDLSPVLAAVGGWVGNGSGSGIGGVDETVGWRVKGSGNWLSVLLAQRDEENLWKD